MIYLLEDRDYLKIGFTRNLKDRLGAYELHNCYAKLLETKEGTLEDERNLHSLCRAYHYKGEWFNNCKEVKEIFHNYKWDGEEWVSRWKRYIEERAFLIKMHWYGFGVTNQGRKLINYLDSNNKEFKTHKAANKLKNFSDAYCNYRYYMLQNEAIFCAVAINKPEIGDMYRLLPNMTVTYGEKE